MLSVAIITLPSLVEDVDNKEVVINQVPFTGTLQYWTTAGTKWQGLGKTTSYEKTSQIWFDQATQDKGGNITLGKADAALPITYNDKGKGVILGSVRVELPLEEKYLQRIQTHYASMDRLVNDLVKPTLSKVITACGPLMSSLESVSEKRTDLIYYITDQLNDGVYRTKVLETKKLNVATGEDELMRIAEPIIDSLSPGGIKRQEASPFSYYGLRVSVTCCMRRLPMIRLPNRERLTCLLSQLRLKQQKQLSWQSGTRRREKQQLWKPNGSRKRRRQ